MHLARALGLLCVSALMAMPSAALGAVDYFPLKGFEGEPYEISGLVTGSDGLLWASLGTAEGATPLPRILRMTPQGEVVSARPAGNEGQSIFYLAVGPDGSAWYEFGSEVRSMAPDGSFRTVRFYRIPSTPGPYAQAGPDEMWVGAGGSIERVGLDGELRAFHELPSRYGVADFTVGPDGNLWIVAGDPRDGPAAILRMTRDGQFTSFPLAHDYEESDIVAGSDGALWFIVDRSSVEGVVSDRIGRVTTAGEITIYPVDDHRYGGDGGHVHRLEGLARGADGNVWFSSRAHWDSDWVGNRPTRGDREQSFIGRIAPGGAAVTRCIRETPSHVSAGPDGNVWFSTSVPNELIRVTPDTAMSADGANCPPPPSCESHIELCPVPQPPDPAVSGLSISPRAFAARRRGGSIGARGARVAYYLSARKRVRFTISRVPSGRRIGGFTHRGRRGENSFRFTGRVGGHALRTGRYRLRASGRNLRCAPGPCAVRFRIR